MILKSFVVDIRNVNYLYQHMLQQPVVKFVIALPDGKIYLQLASLY